MLKKILNPLFVWIQIFLMYKDKKAVATEIATALVLLLCFGSIHFHTRTHG